MIKVLTSLASTIAIASAAYFNAHAQSGVLEVRISDQRQLSFRCGGRGSHFLLLESGLGGDALGWEKLQRLLEAKYRVCSYDRAGSGMSDPGPNPRDADAIAGDLELALESLGVRTQVVFVSHSAGAIFSQRFAELHPKQVAAMVLVDPSAEYQDRRFAEVFGPGAGSIAPMRARLARCLDAAKSNTLSMDISTLEECRVRDIVENHKEAARLRAVSEDPQAISNKISEIDALWSTSSDELLHGYSAIANIPVVVLTASGTYGSVTGPARASVDALWLKLHLETASHYRSSEALTVENTSHLMMNDQPQAIAQAVDHVLQRTKIP